MAIKIFKYIEELGCFVIDPVYKVIADELGLTEWNEAVWIGRFFTLDNDHGEHWFDNWDLRDKLADKAKLLGISYDDMLTIDPERFENGKDGPCHTDEERINFWTDVLKSLALSTETIANEARKFNAERETDDEDFIPNLEDRISKTLKSF